jgi:DNA-binding winged helix-turn-helix (wHTH) protein
MAAKRGGTVERDTTEIVAFGPFRLFAKSRLLERDGVPVELGGRAFDILCVLVNRPGQVVTKTDLMSSVWTDTAVIDGAIRVQVCNLRKALGDGDLGARYITAVAGRGYCFVAPIVRSCTASEELPPPLGSVDQVAAHQCVTIVGAAGIGKTSVSRARGARGLRRCRLLHRAWRSDRRGSCCCDDCSGARHSSESG